MRNIVFIGGGNMAQAIIGGLVKAGRPGASLVVVEPSEAHAAAWSAASASRRSRPPGRRLRYRRHRRLGGQAAGVRGRCRAVPRQRRFGLAAERDGRNPQRPDRRRDRQRARRSRDAEHAGADRPGIAGVFARAAVTDEDRIDAEGLLAATGELVWVGEEAALDAVTALSGSGPAYVFMLLEAMQEAGRQMGLPTYAARRLAEQTVAGSAALAAASAESPAELRRNVTSPGGTTEAAVAILESGGVRAA
jgi:pyrroline-5-carboxylate reductase